MDAKQLEKYFENELKLLATNKIEWKRRYSEAIIVIKVVMLTIRILTGSNVEQRHGFKLILPIESGLILMQNEQKRKKKISIQVAVNSANQIECTILLNYIPVSIKQIKDVQDIVNSYLNGKTCARSGEQNNDSANQEAIKISKNTIIVGFMIALKWKINNIVKKLWIVIKRWMNKVKNRT